MSKLAKTAFKRGDLDGAMQHVADIVVHLDAGHPLDRSVASAIYYECFNVMAAARHPRADEFLRLAYDEVAKQAQQLDATERTMFLKNVATNAEIVKAAVRTQASDRSAQHMLGLAGATASACQIGTKRK